MSEFFIKPWEVVTCYNGHSCYLCVSGIERGEKCIRPDAYMPLNGMPKLSAMHYDADKTRCVSCDTHVFPYLGSLGVYVRGEKRSARYNS